MLKVVGISLGSSSRNHKAVTELAGKEIEVKRLGVDGSLNKASQVLQEIDGTVDAIGLGGIDLYLVANGQKYVIRDAKKLVDCLVKTPVVDGSGLKETLERIAIDYIDRNIISFKDKKVLLVSAVDRFGMAEALDSKGAKILFGDLIFGLNIPMPIYKIKNFERLAKIVLPVITKLPFKVLYPTGVKQDANPIAKYDRYYRWADIIAGDYHLIKKHMPKRLDNKIVITNTITERDIAELRDKGSAMLITTTPEIAGRSFGTNVLEAMFVSIIDKPTAEITENDYLEILQRIDYKPRIEKLND